MTANYQEIYQFKVSLVHIQPTVWRCIQVPCNYDFWGLHMAIQDVFGWENRHLHEFHVRNAELNTLDRIGIPDEEDHGMRPVVLPGWDVQLAAYFSGPIKSVQYLYDFGDGWMHEVKLEDVLPREPGIAYPRCIDGERACPPEDCGGFPGYERLLEIMSDPLHEEYEEMFAWVGGRYDPEAFSTDIKFSNPAKALKAMGY